MDASLTLVSSLLFVATSIPVTLVWRSSTLRVIAAGVVSFAAAVATFHTLGLLSALTGRPLVGPSTVVLTAASLCTLSWIAHRSALRKRRGSFGASGAGEPGRPPSTSGRARVPKSTLALLIFGMATLACAVASALSAPPRGWDVLMYHLPRAVSWLQHGDLGAYGPAAAFYPGNAELVMLHVLQSGSDRLVPLVQVPFLVLSCLAVYEIARSIGARTWSAALAALVLAASPMAFFQSTISKNDLVVTAMIACSALFLLRSLGVEGRRDTRLKEIVLAGLSLGLAVGTKYSVLPVAAVMAACVPLAHSRKGRSGRRPSGVGAVTLTAAFAAAVLVPSLFWYLRNLIVAGNPLAPIGSDALPQGWVRQQFQFVPATFYWWIQPLIDRQSGGTYTGSAGFGAVFGAVYLPSLAICAAAAVSKRASDEFRRRRGLLAILIAAGTAAWWAGGHHLPRYLLPVAALACATSALLFQNVRGRARGVLLALLAAALFFSSAETSRIVFAKNDVTCSYAGGVGRSEFYRMPRLLDAAPSGTRILLLRMVDDEYYFRTFRYPLAGRNRTNEVVMESDPAFGVDLAGLGPDAAHRVLVEKSIDYVFMRVFLNEPFRTWFDDRADLFEIVHDDTMPTYNWYRRSAGRLTLTRVYRVVRD